MSRAQKIAGRARGTGSIADIVDPCVVDRLRAFLLDLEIDRVALPLTRRLQLEELRRRVGAW
jgi:hypothetical protein